MSLASLITGGLGGFVDKVGSVVDRFVQTKDEKAAVMLELERIASTAASELEQTMRSELQTKERVMVAELTQGDNYTKRARPSVVYMGLFMMLWNYTVTPFVSAVFSLDLPVLPLPEEFWYVFGGVTSVWSVGRTMERRGSKNNLMTVINGKSPSLID